MYPEYKVSSKDAMWGEVGWGGGLGQNWRRGMAFPYR